MKEIVIKNGERYIECTSNGCEVEFRRNDENIHDRETAKSPEHIRMMKRDVRNLYNSYRDKNVGYDKVWHYMHSKEFHDKYFDGSGDFYCDLRSRDDIETYLEEATDKSWFDTALCDMKKGRGLTKSEKELFEEIIKKYDDIPRDGYDDFEGGYWAGVMAALRWVTGLEKDCLEL